MKYIIIFLLSFSVFSCNLQEVVNAPPPTYELKQNFPNPFADSTTVLYGIPTALSGTLGPTIKIVVKDRFNQLYATLVNTSNHPAGHNFKVVWNGRGLNYQKAPPGIYYVELQKSDEVIKRIAALKQ